jgi:hypothetical protein
MLTFLLSKEIQIVQEIQKFKKFKKFPILCTEFVYMESIQASRDDNDLGNTEYVYQENSS